MLVHVLGINGALGMKVETDHVMEDYCVTDRLETLLFGQEASQEFTNVVVDQVFLKYSDCL